MGGQTMITAGFFVLLILLVISANRMINESTVSIDEGDAINLSVDIGRAVISEVYRKVYDEKWIDSVYQATTDYTAPSLLGPESDERFALPDVVPYKSFLRYDDVDDYNGYSRVVDAGSIKGFKVSVQVYYVDPSTFAKTNTQTYLKKVDVSVEHPTYLQPKVTYSTIVTR
jgi:hypothetical protein